MGLRWREICSEATIGIGGGDDTDSSKLVASMEPTRVPAGRHPAHSSAGAGLGLCSEWSAAAGHQWRVRALSLLAAERHGTAGAAANVSDACSRGKPTPRSERRAAWVPRARGIARHPPGAREYFSGELRVGIEH